MNHQLTVFSKILDAEPETLVPQHVEDTLDKLINITRVAQFEQLHLTDEDCENIIMHLDNVEDKLRSNNSFVDKIKTARAEFLPIIFSDEDYI